MQMTRTIVLSSFLFAVACSRPLGPAQERLSGTFDLAEINAQALPIDRGPLPPRGGERLCNVVLEKGRLSLNPERQRYDLHYLTRSTCDGRILSLTGSVGSYTQLGSKLVFEIPSIDRPRQFRGNVAARAIVVQFYDQRMVFRLPGFASASPISGSFSRRAAPGRPMPAESAGSIGGGCSLTVDSVSLEVTPDPSARTLLAPATGRFALRRALRNSCTARITHRSEERGSYEQIARVVYFEAYPAPRTFREFHAVILSDREIEVIAGAGFPQRFTR
jgi:hypothetical protein